MEKDFFAAIRDRRSFYFISDSATISDEQIENIVKEAVKYTPTPFNCQSGRVIILFGEQHKKLWDFAKEAIKKAAPESFATTKIKIEASFAAGYGTVLFFEDKSVVEGLQNRFPLYKSNFPLWSQQTSGMLQLIVWSALEVNGLGASLQHYNPLIDEAVKKEWSVPDSWMLIAQMPFGEPVEQPDVKEFIPVEKRMKIFK